MFKVQIKLFLTDKFLSYIVFLTILVYHQLFLLSSITYLPCYDHNEGEQFPRIKISTHQVCKCFWYLYRVNKVKD